MITVRILPLWEYALNILETTRRVSVASASGPGRRDYSARLRDSASDPARGLGATYDPACLSDPARASGPVRRDYSTRLRDSTSDPVWGLGATYDPARLRDSASDSARGLGAVTTRYVLMTCPGL